MNYPKKVRLVEVGPRDGLQNEAKPVPVDAKVTLIDAHTAKAAVATDLIVFVSEAFMSKFPYELATDS